MKAATKRIVLCAGVRTPIGHLAKSLADLLPDGGLRVVGVNYDGSPNAYRIVDPRQFIVSAKFEF